ncbi:hypothetical protein OD91_0879 [Lutibacter sp. Hel_I_33_5]|uniref:hypothetical protein n=1 Tax=Lutibacter sp. Hel_I_33_5 TaxID=1566289 RepID=UPI0011ABCAA9|nr:hypothetical protein [Lutibacter sp. Hel_I_33_5]TVZ55624.1 hypothetical protein OD91_0879 [Lutibacter sp. Hel_I_33_5]
MEAPKQITLHDVVEGRIHPVLGYYLPKRKHNATEVYKTYSIKMQKPNQFRNHKV